MKTASYTARRTAVVLAFGALTAAFCVGQDVPNGVHYKRLVQKSTKKQSRARTSACRYQDPEEISERNDPVVGRFYWDDSRRTMILIERFDSGNYGFVSSRSRPRRRSRLSHSGKHVTSSGKLLLDKYPGLRKGMVRPLEQMRLVSIGQQFLSTSKSPSLRLKRPRRLCGQSEV